VYWVLTVPTPRIDWEKTSLKPYVDILDKHAIRIMNEVRQGKIKTGESMLFIPKGFELTCVRRQHLVVVGFEYICVFMLLCCTLPKFLCCVHLVYHEEVFHSWMQARFLHKITVTKLWVIRIKQRGQEQMAWSARPQTSKQNVCYHTSWVWNLYWSPIGSKVGGRKKLILHWNDNPTTDDSDTCCKKSRYCRSDDRVESIKSRETLFQSA